MDGQQEWESRMRALGIDPGEVLARQCRRAILPGGELRQTCKACGEPHKLEFHVTDAVWESVVPESLRSRVVCLDCFDDFALEKGIKYAAHLRELYFAGDRAAFTFKAERWTD